MKSLRVAFCIVGVAAIATPTASAEKTGEIIKPEAAKSKGFIVRITKDKNNLCSASVTMTKKVLIPGRMIEAALVSDHFNLPLAIVVGGNGERWVSFFMTRKLLDGAKIHIGFYSGSSQHWSTFILKDYPTTVMPKQQERKQRP